MLHFEFSMGSTQFISLDQLSVDKTRLFVESHIRVNEENIYSEEHYFTS